MMVKQFHVYCGSKMMVRNISTNVGWEQAERLLLEELTAEGFNGLFTRIERVEGEVVVEVEDGRSKPRRRRYP